MNNVSLQLQQYRALKAQATHAPLNTDTNVLERHPEKTDYFHNLMLRWEASYLGRKLSADTGESA